MRKIQVFSATVFLFFFSVPCALSQKLPGAKPEDVGLSSEHLKRIDPAMQRYVAENKLAGILTMIARRGKVVHFEQYGMMDKEKEKPLQRDTIFRIYSMTKPITSVAVMMLYEQGHFQLNDPVSRYVPELKDLDVFDSVSDGQIQTAPANREMTIRDLLLHTSGLTYGLIGDTPIDLLYQDVDVRNPEGTLKDMIRKLSQIPLLYQPGSRFHYSVSTDVLAYLVEVVSGTAYDQFLKEKIFQPLNMKDTGYFVPEEKLNRLAVNYGPKEGGGMLAIDAPSKSSYSKPTRFFAGGTGLVSTASDYMRFAQMILNGGELNGVRVLGRKSVELMLANNLPDKILDGPRLEMPQNGHPLYPGLGFGLGFSVVMDVGQTGDLGSVGRAHWAGAASTSFWIDPKEEMAIMAFAQFIPYGHYPFQDEFRVIAYGAVID